MSSELNLKVGETAKTSKVEVTVVSAKRLQSYDYYSDILGYNVTKEASPGKIFVLLEAEIKSISDNAFVGSSEFSVVNSEGYKYDQTLYYGADGLEIIKQLPQNQRTKGKVLFEVPEASQDVKIQYDFGNLLIGTKLASWTIQ